MTHDFTAYKRGYYSWHLIIWGVADTRLAMREFLKRDDSSYDWSKVMEFVETNHPHRYNSYKFNELLTAYKSINKSIDCTKVDSSLNYFDIFESSEVDGMYSFTASVEKTKQFIFKLMGIFPSLTFILESYGANVYTEFRENIEVDPKNFQYWKISN
jgi:hypothetical protein